MFLILIVRYFEFALEAPIAGALDLLYLAIGIALIALSLFLTRSPAEKHPARIDYSFERTPLGGEDYAALAPKRKR